MDVTRIDLMIATGEFFSNPVLLAAMHHARAGHRLHLMGLCSDGGVHSQLTHLYALLEMAKRRRRRAGVSCTASWMGAIRRRRAASATSANPEEDCAKSASGKIASVEGRYYAMDRDKRWERIERAFNAMVLGNGEKATDPVEVMQRSYEKGVTDEFIEPVTIVDEQQRASRSDSRRRCLHLFQLSAPTAAAR